MYKYLIVFTGLCGFVPRQGAKEVNVLMVAAREVIPYEQGHYIPEHLPVVLFRERGGNVLTGRAPDLYYETAAGDRMAMVVVRRETISLKDHGGVASRPDAAALSAVADVGKVLGSTAAAEVDAADLTHKHALGVFKIGVGRLRTTLATDEIGDVIEWDFKPIVGGTAAQYGDLAEEVALELSSSKPTLALEAVDEDGDPAWTLELRHGGGNEALRVDVKNLPLAAIFGLDHPHHETKRDPHFMWFYRLLKKTPAALPVPHVRGLLLNMGNPKCPPALFPAK